MFSIDLQSFKRSIESLREYPSLAISYTSYKALTALFMLIPPPTPRLVPSVLGSYVCIFLAVAAWCILFAAFGRDSTIFERRSYLLGAGAILALGITVLAFELLGVISDDILELVHFLAGILLLTGGYSSVHIEFGRLMGELGMTYTLIFNIGCLVLAIPITGLIVIFPSTLQLASALILVALCVLFLDRAIDQLGRGKLYHGTDAPLSIPVRFMFTSFAQGISAGLLFTVFATAGIQQFWGESLAGTLSALAALVFGLMFRIDFDRLIYRIGFACIGIGCTVWAVAGPCGSLRELSSLVQLFSFTYLDIVLWSLGSHLIKDREQPALWVAACPTASLLIGRCVGSLIGANAGATQHSVTLESSLLAADTPAGIAAITGCLFMFIALQLSSGKNIENGWGFIKPNETNALSALEHACALITGDFRLTEREHDVLLRLAQGKTKKEIAEELFVTQNTIKTHQRNLYTKLDVHSLDDLKKFVTHQQRAFESHGEC